MMKSFDTLTHGGQVRRLRRLATAVLAQYAIIPTRMRLLTHLYNTTFRVDTDDGRYVLRISRAGGRTQAEIRSEMQWLAAISRDTDLIVPNPVSNKTGALVTTAAVEGVPSARHCVLFEWVHGRFQVRNLTPTHLHRVGVLMARLHQHVAHFAQPDGFTRKVLGFGGELDDFAALAWEKGADLIEAQDRETFLQAAAVLRAQTAQMGTDSPVYNLVHADLHQRNYLFHQGVVCALDFDDCGWGHFAYDMGVTLWYVQGHPRYDALRQAFLAGYRQERPFTVSQEAHIDTYMQVRTYVMAMYVAGETNPAIRARATAFIAQMAAQLRTFLAATNPSEYRPG